jgi:hypothetical protein
MSRGKIPLAALAVLVLAAPPAAAKSRDRTIKLTARSQLEHAQLVDNAPTGDSPGDLLVFTERLYDRHGKRIGSDAASCVRLFDKASLCHGTYKLPGGRLMVQLLQPGPTGTYDQAITGGTGRFDGAHGTVRVAQKTGGDRFTFRIRL